VPVEVVVRISPDMFREDAVALRHWLEQAYPVDWAEVPDPDRQDSLSTMDVVLTAVFSGAVGALGDEVADAVREKIKGIARRYRDRKPPGTVDSREVPEPAAPDQADSAPPPGPDHDAH
jgi:hypothetical protein